MCGENVRRCAYDKRPRGSPPRVRGKPFGGLRSNGLRRITPACAGKTAVSFIVWLPFEDHPRVCGENVFGIMADGYKLGSPPRVRGKLASPAISRRRSRITPACAGKTAQETGGSGGVEDHPRVCGENYPYQRQNAGDQGSPPRVRGKLLVEQQRQPLVRITPACAGKTE